MRLPQNGPLARAARTYAMLVVLLAGSVGGAGCTDSLVDLDRNDLAAANLEPGIHRRSASMGDLGELRYTVSVPFLVSGRRYPLVIALHGGGPVTPYVSEGYLKAQAEPGLRELGAIIVAPDIPSTTWVEPTAVELVTEFVEIVLDLERSWPIDPTRVVITGYSAGGLGVWHLTDVRPDLFSAGIPVAAQPLLGNRSGSAAVPLFVIHGGQDEFFPIADVERVVQQAASRNVPVTLHVEETFSHTQRASYSRPLMSAVPWLTENIWTSEND